MRIDLGYKKFDLDDPIFTLGTWSIIIVKFIARKILDDIWIMKRA